MLWPAPNSEAVSALGVDTAQRFHRLCTPASCKAEYIDVCTKLAQRVRAAGRGDKADHILRMCSNGEGYYNYTPAMMHGPSSPGIMEGVLKKFLGAERARRTVFMLVSVTLRAACDLAPRLAVGIYKVNKFFKVLIRNQRMNTAKIDSAAFEILSHACQKLSYYAITMIQERLLLSRHHARTPSGMVRHNRIERYEFKPSRDSNGKWTCVDQYGSMCWRNKLYGIPCEHILAVWSDSIRCNNGSFDYNDVEMSTLKLYRRATYDLKWSFFPMVIYIY